MVNILVVLGILFLFLFIESNRKKKDTDELNAKISSDLTNIKIEDLDKDFK